MNLLHEKKYDAKMFELLDEEDSLLWSRIGQWTGAEHNFVSRWAVRL